MDITIEGLAVGLAYFNNTIPSSTIIYHATPVPPSGTALTTYTPILMNKRRYTYKIGGDFLQTKLMVFKGKELSYIEGAAAELWLNYEGYWRKYEDYTTNRYGIAHLKHTTDYFPEIKCCLGLVRVTIDSQIYNSNIVRFNFVEGFTTSYLIDAGSCDEIITDRSAFYIFDAENRTCTYGRMWGL